MFPAAPPDGDPSPAPGGEGRSRIEAWSLRALSLSKRACRNARASLPFDRLRDHPAPTLRPFDGLRDRKLRERLRAQAHIRGFGRAMYMSSLPFAINP